MDRIQAKTNPYIDEVESKIKSLQDVIEKLVINTNIYIQKYSQVEHEKCLFQKKLEASEEEVKIMKKRQDEQDKENARLKESIQSLHNQRKDMIVEADKELSAQTQVIKLKYEVKRCCIILSEAFQIFLPHIMNVIRRLRY
jgi:chromosome segregation ATPase